MSRYVIDAPTLLQLVDRDLSVHSSHQLVAPNSVRSEALQLLLRGVRRGERTEAAALHAHEPAKADGIVPVAPLEVLLSPESGR